MQEQAPSQKLELSKQHSIDIFLIVYLTVPVRSLYHETSPKRREATKIGEGEREVMTCFGRAL